MKITKFCRRCKTDKPTSEFYRYNRTSDGLQVYCKDCQREQHGVKRPLCPPTETENYCYTCSSFKAKTDFYAWRPYRCKPCAREHMRSYRKRNQERVALWENRGTHAQRRKDPYHRLKKYKLTKDEYHRMVENQGNGCAICGGRNKGKHDLVVDHCHKTKKVRGLLCSFCNSGIGLFLDNPESLEKAAQYIRSRA